VRPGPNARAKRQKRRDTRAHATKPITAAKIERTLETNSLSGAILGGRQRTRRVPAYVIRQRVITPPPFVEAWRAYRNRGAK